MKSHPSNPAENGLSPGLSEKQLSDAVAASGYPLQTIVAQRLRGRFRIVEEWSFLDPESQQLRTLDVRASTSLAPETGLRVRPKLDVLIECKRSDLPYLFFTSSADSALPRLPVFAGLRRDSIEVSTDSSRSTWTMRLPAALGMLKHPFLAHAPLGSHSFSKAARKGKDLELSGSEAFHHAVFPLVKALRHLTVLMAPPKTAHYFDCHLGVGVVVLDAPMVAVEVSEEGHELSAAPWVRVSRNEYVGGDHWFDRSETLVIDVVHQAFLNSYIDNHLMPFATLFGTRIAEHAEEVAEGKGFVPGLDKDSWTDLELRLRPR